jgi:hypothetical protein
LNSVEGRRKCHKVRAKQVAEKLVALKGHGFSRAVSPAISTWALQAAEKLSMMPIHDRFVTGHDFSRADKANRPGWASQAAEKLSMMPIHDRFVTGHDFSRADKANRPGWASAPAEPILPFHAVPTPFSAACLAPEGRFAGIPHENGRFPVACKSQRQSPADGVGFPFFAARVVAPTPVQQFIMGIDGFRSSLVSLGAEAVFLA